MNPIHCAKCNMPTGAWFIDGDPYLPLIYCSACAEKEADRRVQHNDGRDAPGSRAR